MEIFDLLQLAANKADAWNQLQQLFIAVSTALLALVAASSKPLSKQSAAVICIGFSFFLIGNYKAFSDYHSIREKIVEITCDAKGNLDETHLCIIAKKDSIIKLAEEMGPPGKIRFIFLLGHWHISSCWPMVYSLQKKSKRMKVFLFQLFIHVVWLVKYILLNYR